MRTVVGKLAAVALCATALTAFSYSANASTVDFTTGTPGPLTQATPNPLYGGALSDNNVINSPGSPATNSALYNSTSPATPAATPWIQQTAATTSLSTYYVAWFFAGSESGYTITFNAPSTVTQTTPVPLGPVTYTEHDNNNNIGGAPLPGGAGYKYLGMTEGNTSLIDFTLNWLSGGAHSISNGDTTAPGTNGVPSLIFSYINPVFDANNLFTGQWDLTHNATDWFAFGLNDTGGPDDNHDDYVGFALVSRSPGGGPGTTPIPGALPLFSTVLGGGLAFSTWRKRRKNKGAAKLATA